MVQLGTVQKEIAVFGDRQWKRPGTSMWDITTPRQVVSLPISYVNSFGGSGFEKNPLGKGFFKQDNVKPNEPFFLPNLEDPRFLIAVPSDTPEPVGFGPIDPMWQQRASKAGTYDGAWLMQRFPGHPADIDWSFYNLAPQDQQISGFFNGDESFQIENMNSRQPVITGALPGIRPRSFVNQLKDGSTVFQEIPLRLDTVWFFPTKEVGALLYRGVHRVQDPDSEDILHQLIAYESMGDASRSIEHYQKTLMSRLDDGKSQIHLLDERPLIPNGERSGFSDLIAGSDDKPAVLKESILKKNMKARSERARDEVKQKMDELGLNSERLFEKEEPVIPEVNFENLDAVISAIENYSERIKPTIEEQQERARSRLEELGLNYDEMKSSADNSGGRPKFGAAERVSLLKEHGLCDAEIEKKLFENEAKFDYAYRKFGHHFPSVSGIGKSEARRKREFVVAGIAKGDSFSGIDLTGADLSGLEVRGGDFSEAFMEGVDLSGSKLSDCVFRGCALMRSRLDNTVIDGSNLDGANLGYSESTGGLFKNSDCSNTIFYGAILDDVTFENCKVADADYSNACLTNSRIADSDFSRARFIESKVERIKIEKSKFEEAIFIDVKWVAVDFEQSLLTGVICVNLTGENVVFCGSDLSNFRAVGETSLSGADFGNCILTEGSFRNGIFDNASFVGANLRRSDFSNCRLHNALLSNAVANEAQFVKADLTSAKMAGINLCEGSLQQACLHETDLHGANLYGVDFIEAKFRNTNISGANRKKAFLDRWIQR